jgi:hypothetical protein
MLSIPPTVPIFLYTPPADLRKGFDGLSGLVRRVCRERGRVMMKLWRRRMGIEPTRDPCEPHTGFEDQGHHQAPVTSASLAGPRIAG